MIHIVTISEIPSLVVGQVCRHLYLCYAVGAEHSAHMPPASSSEIEASELLATTPPFSRFSDDKTILLTDDVLTLPEGPMGSAPSGGFADLERGLAVVTTNGIPLPEPPGKDEDELAWKTFADRVARRAVQQAGFLWGLRRCVDVRCAMMAPWVSDAPPSLCDFCRERSEEAIRRTRS